jgi:thiol-disulfide isomerase/thioredoxin
VALDNFRNAALSFIFSETFFRCNFMRNGLVAIALLCLIAGCDLQSLMGPPTRTAARPIPNQQPPALAPPSLENQLRDIDSQLKDKPDDINLLKTKAIILQSTAHAKIQGGDSTNGYAEYEESAAIWKKIKAATPELNDQDEATYATAVYNLACALSLKKEIDPALAALRDSLEHGFSQTGLLKTDKDLDNLREHADFKAMIENLAQFRIAAAKKHISKDPLFPFQFSLTNLNGEAVSLKDFTGKVVIVDVWGTWCPPCRQEIPHFVALHQKYKDKGFEIIGINYERGESPEANRKLVVDFAAKNNVLYNCVMGDEETQKQIPAFEGYPTTLFVDREGKVRAKVVGYHQYDDLEAMVEVLLNETPAAPVQ